MKNSSITYGNEIGRLLMRKNTIMAAVLVRLLQDNSPLTTWEAVEAFGTLYLASAIRRLMKLGWSIDRVEVPLLKADGVISYVPGYELPKAVFDLASSSERIAYWIKDFKVEQVRARAINDANAVAREYSRQIGHHCTFLDDVARFPYGR